jgi:tetratricopeptide (TPR) repeat protein
MLAKGFEEAALHRPRDLATILNNLGMACKYAGLYEEGEAAYLRALDLLGQMPVPPMLELATLHHNLGGLEHARGRHAIGEQWARRGLAIREAEAGFGGESVEVASDMAALAALLDAQSKFEESEPLHLRALAIFERELGPEHLETGIVLGNIGALRSAQGRSGEALELLKRSMAIKQQHLSAAHPSLGWAWNNLAVLERTCGNRAAAAEYFARALSLLEPALGTHHRHVVTCRSNYEAVRIVLA